jgi:hypothetical protein
MHFYLEIDIDWNVAIYKYQVSTIHQPTIQILLYFFLRELLATTNEEALEVPLQQMPKRIPTTKYIHDFQKVWNVSTIHN